MTLGSVIKNYPSKLSNSLTEAINSISSGVLLFNSSGSLLFINVAAQSMLGLGKKSSLNSPLLEIFFFSDAILDVCKRSLSTGNAYDCYSGVLRKTDKADINVVAKASMMDSVSPILLLELIDITKNDTLRDERFNSQQQLNKKIARQLAHEIKNPLGGLRGAAQLLDRKLPNKELKKYTDIIIKESDRLTTLVDSILIASTKTEKRNINPHEVTERVYELLKDVTPDNVNLIKDYDPSLPTIYVDFNQVVQAYLNIAKNAIEALEKSGGKIVLKTRVERNRVANFSRVPMAAVLSVMDDGPGIPDDFIENIFYPLVSTKDSGSGLGLTIAQGQTERNQGSIEVQSRPGMTMFSLIFPLVGARA
jgi:two-component system nitrogen regulation sensor histidine kinase GlnL